MKTAPMIKSLTAGAILAANITVIGLANAQTQQSTETTVSFISPPGKQASKSVARPARDVLFRGGYNVGRGTASQVPGCTGPVSFCNMYNGS
ncbi:hypothetical protein [Paraburkholderia dipogonis]|uniref:hypothetical protein n=1 Tax=Paraburkholderia dipogonis TaxID=1211383 RepID=UPI0038B93F6B